MDEYEIPTFKPQYMEHHVNKGMWVGLACALLCLLCTQAWNAVAADRLKLRELDLRTAWILFGSGATVASMIFHDNEMVWNNKVEEEQRRANLSIISFQRHLPRRRREDPTYYVI